MGEMKIADEYISDLFKGTRFGATIDNSVKEQRKYLQKSIQQQMEGYWSGSTMYSIMVHGGFIVDSKKGTHKKTTALGDLLMNDGVNNG